MTTEERQTVRQSIIVGSAVFIAVGIGMLIAGVLWRREFLIGLGVILALVSLLKLIRAYASQ